MAIVKKKKKNDGKFMSNILIEFIEVRFFDTVSHIRFVISFPWIFKFLFMNRKRFS